MGHPQITCFKSLVKDIISSDDIRDKLGYPLSYQYSFKKRVSPPSRKMSGLYLKNM